MNAEGIGITSPSPVKFVMSEPDMQLLHTESLKRAEYRGYRARQGTWEQGLLGDSYVDGIGTLRKDVRPIFAGLLGEYATALLVNRRFPGAAKVDLRLRKGGDFGIDLQVFGLTLQVKTRQNSESHNLVKRINERGALLRIPARGCVFCEWTGGQIVSVLGWCWTKDIEWRETEQSSLGSWRNIVVRDCDLLPARRLIDDLSARKQLL